MACFEVHCGGMMLSRLSGALLAVALPFAVSGVASACPDTTLTLTVTTQDGDAESVKLTCEPPGGTHPNAKSACREILIAHGNFESLPGDQEVAACTLEYSPVVAVAEGMWRGAPVSWEHEYGNACSLHRETGAVFLF
jgi:hypothetical protein